MSGLKNKGIDIDKVCSKLLEDGLVSFEKSFDSLLTTIEKKTPRS
jgi:transaldolase